MSFATPTASTMEGLLKSVESSIGSATGTATTSSAKSAQISALKYHEPGLDFGAALKWLKLGFRLRRRGWNGKGIFIKIQEPDAHSFMTHPYIYIDSTGLETDNGYAPKNRVPWLASQTDMLAEDWKVVR